MGRYLHKEFAQINWVFQVCFNTARISGELDLSKDSQKTKVEQIPRILVKQTKP